MTTLDAAVKWGILSTADINRKVIPGAHASEKVELIAVASRDLRRAEVAGGSLMDVGCYCVSGSRLLAGEPEQVYGQQFVGPSGTDWVFTGTMRFPGDVFAQFDCGTALSERDELEAIGNDGSLFLDDPWHCREPVIELRRDGGMERIEVELADSYRLELENLSDAVRGATDPLLGREDAVGQARAIDALYRSAVSGTAASL